MFADAVALSTISVQPTGHVTAVTVVHPSATIILSPYDTTAGRFIVWEVWSPESAPENVFRIIGVVAGGRRINGPSGNG